MIHAEQLKQDTLRTRAALAELALKRTLLEGRLQTLAWHEELLETLARGGAGRSPWPYDTEGVWRLAQNRTSRSLAFEPVLALEELPPHTEAHKRVVPFNDLVFGTCSECGDNSPVLGRGRITDAGMGNVRDVTEIVVVHCDQITSQTPETVSITIEDPRMFTFNPHTTL